MLPLISPEELKIRLATAAPVLLDARSGPEARARYAVGHLPGAQFVDLEHDLAHPGPDAALGGRHPLPAVADFARLLGRLGIAPATPVVVYDDKSGANAAARAWWLLRAAGHAAVQVLDGGLPAAEAAGLALSSEQVPPSPTAPYPFSQWQLPTTASEEVQWASREGSRLIIDVREAPRFRGEHEPIDLIAGHIPNAINVPFAGNLAATGRYLPPVALRAKYEALLQGRNPADVLVHCGSGVTACHTLLAFEQAGLPLPSLYVGSWSEWSRNPNPIATGG